MQKSEVGRLVNPSGETLFEADVHVLRERVVLRLSRSPDMPCQLERRLVRSDGATLTQILPINDGAVLHDFAAADPYGDHLRAQYQSIERAHREQPGYESGRLKTPPGKHDPLEEISCIRACSSEAELMVIVSHVLAQLGGQAYTYRWLHVDERTGVVSDQRCLVGCPPGWLHAYISHQWYRRDPFVEYARRNGGPALASDIDALGEHQWANDVAARYGFRSMLVCPAHPPSGAMIGLLQVGNTLQQAAGERTLWQNRVLLRALADEILDWGIATQRDEEASRVDLDQRELAVLRLLRAGRTACNVAESLGISERTTYVIFRKINEKLGVSHIARAVETATARGLIE